MNGVPGTVTFNLNGSNDAALNVHATATIVDAGGRLAGLHGVLHEVQTVVFPQPRASLRPGRRDRQVAGGVIRRCAAALPVVAPSRGARPRPVG